MHIHFVCVSMGDVDAGVLDIMRPCMHCTMEQELDDKQTDYDMLTGSSSLDCTGGLFSC